MAWVPNSEITSASRSPQWGQRGEAPLPPSRGGPGSGVAGFLGLGKALLLEAAQHRKSAVVDGAGPSPSTDRVPVLPLDRRFRSPCLETLLQPGVELGRPHAQAAIFVELCGLPVRRAKPLDRFAPRAVQRLDIDARAQPAAAMEKVVALLHQHLAEPVSQDF